MTKNCNIKPTKNISTSTLEIINNKYSKNVYPNENKFVYIIIKVKPTTINKILII